MPPAIAANPPGPSVVVGWPVISATIVPLTIRTCSWAVCECQGTTQPDGAFRTKVEGPVAGLPVSTADDRHFTSASGRNCTDESGRRVPATGPWARADPPATIARQPIKSQPSRDFTACAYSVEIAHRQAERVEAVIRALVDVRVDQIATLHDAIEHRLALRDRRPVVECRHGDQRRLADGELGTKCIGQRTVGIDQDR